MRRRDQKSGLNHVKAGAPESAPALKIDHNHVIDAKNRYDLLCFRLRAANPRPISAPPMSNIVEGSGTPVL